ncbi:hypothetical protein CPB86DRAFT_758889 [Serendipita vermifera]|nr:hypothetical protein CPB86DRAFT_758889 [Serendipita vermifera]
MAARIGDAFQIAIKNILDPNAFSSNQETLDKWNATIITAYSETQRHYHTVEHIRSMLDSMDSVDESEIHDKNTVVLAILFHDIVYEPRSAFKQNELQSIDMWNEFAKELALDNRIVEDVTKFIEATITHSLPVDYPTDLPFFLDLDLEVLGRPREDYIMYASQIREEYAHYSIDEYCKGRTKVLQRLLSGGIYFTDYWKSRLSDAARANMQWEIEQLTNGMLFQLIIYLEPQIAFPTRDEPLVMPASSAAAVRRPTHLPFRRISMPTVPSPATMAQIRAMNTSQQQDRRLSVTSQQSFESTQENYPPQSQLQPGSNATPSGISRPRRMTSRPSSLQPPPKASALAQGNVAKRNKVLRELLDTEKTYVEGLELISEHFLNPLVRATTDGQPLLSPGQMSSVFSNFVDMLGFHQTFYATLNEYLGPYVKPTQPPSSFVLSTSPSSRLQQPSTSSVSESPPIARLLAKHIPFLNMYMPFVTAYPNIVMSLHSLTSPQSSNFSPQFTSWLREREAHPLCKKIRLQDWLLILIQRCPRYQLLLRDIINYTEPTDPEYVELEEVSKLLAKITLSLNTSMADQDITFQLLDIQRATPNLPFPFIEPGRKFIRRGPLFQVADRVERFREFILFSDCLVWLSKGGERESPMTSEEEQFRQSVIQLSSSPSTNALSRRLSDVENVSPRRGPSTASGPKRPNSTHNQSEEQKWWFRGKIDLLDLDIVLPVPSFGEEGKIEVHSPHLSFSLFCYSIEDREAWATDIRSAKQSRLIAMNSTNPNSTLTSSSSTQHLRTVLRAIPYAPDTENVSITIDKKKPSKKDKAKARPDRRPLEYYSPPLWVPNSKADSCIRCGGVFNWRRRRHHCRLCGNCVCANCSGKTFFTVKKVGTKESFEAARACNSCYEAVFPVVDSDSTDEDPTPEHRAHYSSIGTLTALPFSKSTPSLALLTAQEASPYPTPMKYELPVPIKVDNGPDNERPKSGLDFLPMARPKLPGSRPPSEFRSSSYSPSVIESQSPVFKQPNASSATMSTFDSPISPAGRMSFDIKPRPRPSVTFSTPALALHTTPVTAKVSVSADGRSSRHSLVFSNKPRTDGGDSTTGSKDNEAVRGRRSLDAGLAMHKLTDLLGRK